ncbi:MAG: glycosyltransferase [Actinomycetota bacterium]|nr:glycosyltransferase [Actinomycetota bacterium]
MSAAPGAGAGGTVGTPASARQRIAVCICTYQRADVINGLLERLTHVAEEAMDVAEVGVVVVDDDPAASAERVAERYAGTFELGLVYIRSGAGNISTARNLALEHGTQLADWLALIDDDCLPDLDWLRELLAVQAAHDAEAVSGHCIDEPPPDGPRWFVDEPFLVESFDHADGAILESGALKNTLLSSAFVRRHALLFDEAFGTIGGEDVMFFRAAHRAGLRHHFASSAVVREQLPTDRATLAYQLRRALWHGNTEAVTSVAASRVGRARMMARGAKLVATSSIRPFRQVVASKQSEWRFALCGVLQGAGRLLGAIGIRLRHR